MAFVRFKRSDIDARWAMAGKSMELQLVVDWDPCYLGMARDDPDWDDSVGDSQAT